MISGTDRRCRREGFLCHSSQSRQPRQQYLDLFMSNACPRRQRTRRAATNATLQVSAATSKTHAQHHTEHQHYMCNSRLWRHAFVGPHVALNVSPAAAIPLNCGQEVTIIVPFGTGHMVARPPYTFRAFPLLQQPCSLLPNAHGA